MSQSDDGNTSDLDNDGLCQPGNENTGRWTSDEHRLFLKGLELHGKGWKQIATLIQTRTVVQIRTHAQKYFQKLSKAQASGTSHLDPATLMSTMDASKPRSASMTRNLRSCTTVNNGTESEGRLMSLRNHRNRGRRSSCEIASVEGSSDGDGSTEEDEDEQIDGDHRGEGYREKPVSVMIIARQEAPKFTVGGGNGSGTGVHKEANDSMDMGKCFSSPQDGASAGWRKRRLGTSSKRERTCSTKHSKATTASAKGGAADARALAWEAASVKSHAMEVATAAAGAFDGAAVLSVGNGTGTKRTRSESTTSSSSLGDTIKNLKHTTGSQGTRISPTSVSDINFMSFPVPYQEHSDIAMHHLPQQLAPSWCTKPQDAWMAGAGIDVGADSEDAGPFRWFIDERSLSAPGAFFQPPVEAWSGSDTTDASISAGATSGGEGSTVDGDQQTLVPDLPVSTKKVDASLASGITCEETHNSNEIATKRRCTGPMVPMPIDSQADVPVSDAAIASEVTRHVEEDNVASGGGLDITSGLWLDHPQDVSPLMYGLGLCASSVAGYAGGLSLPSLDEEEVLGFLACAENPPASDVET